MSELVVKDNALMNASYNLDLVEQRLILLAIIEARESGKGINANDPLTVHAETYINQFGVHRNTAYQALKDACNNLFARQLSYQEINKRGNVENVRSRWVSEVRYVDAEATVKLVFAPIVIPLITRLEEQFTKYDIEQISGLSSAYAVRLYELLICWRSTGKTPIIDLAEFKKRMGVLEGDYARSDNFKKWVLDNPLEQINQHTDITVSYEQHKTGRNITGFSFKFKIKKQLLSQKEMPNKPKKPSKNSKPTAIPQADLSGLELVLFNDLKKHYPTLTREYIFSLAKTEELSTFDLLRRMESERLSGVFELMPSA